MSETFSPVLIFEDEDEQALKSEFVRLMAKWRAKYSTYEVCTYIFRELREPTRAFAAAQHWGSDLELLDKIDREINVPKNSNLDSREERLLILKTIYSDINESARERLKALELHAQIEGEIIKQVDKKTTDNTPKQLPVFTFTRYQDD